MSVPSDGKNVLVLQMRFNRLFLDTTAEVLGIGKVQPKIQFPLQVTGASAVRL